MDFITIKPNDKCLVLAPHADDESIGCGGLLLKYPNNFEVVVLTDGRKGGAKMIVKNLSLRQGFKSCKKR